MPIQLQPPQAQAHAKNGLSELTREEKKRGKCKQGRRTRRTRDLLFSLSLLFLFLLRAGSHEGTFLFNPALSIHKNREREERRIRMPAEWLLRITSQGNILLYLSLPIICLLNFPVSLSPSKGRSTCLSSSLASALTRTDRDLKSKDFLNGLPIAADSADSRRVLRQSPDLYGPTI